LIDYAQTKLYKDKTTKEHIPFKENIKFSGNIWYSSLHAHQGYEQSRRDDLESLGYMLVYFMKGKLPWQSVKDKEEAKVYKMKHETSLKDLTKDLPKEFFQYLH
jgi:serine/threonine protein kinase